MGRILLSSLLFVITMSCGDGSPKPGQEGPLSCSNPTPGHLCVGGQMVAKLGGMCSNPGQSKPTDCPPFYNYCDSNYRCVSQLTTGESQIWFATDAIRPGVVSTCNTNSCSAPNDYIYNIMAKGYDSLDDWCMSQAQQSTLPGMKNVSSWTALIIAQPDETNTTIKGLSASGNYRILQYTNIQTLKITPPVASFGNFSNKNNSMYDKNGNLLFSGGGANSTWSGLNYNGHGLPYGGTCLAVTDPDQCVNVELNDCCGYLTTDSYCSPCGSDEDQYSLNVMIPTLLNLQVYTGQGANNNSWGVFSGAAGVSIFPVTNCDNEPNSFTYVTFGGVGLEFATDCGDGSTYNANGTQQKPIICLANQSS